MNKLMDQSHVAEGSAVIALGTMIVNEVVKWDAFFHSAASVLACLAAIVSIYYTIRKNNGK